MTKSRRCFRCYKAKRGSLFWKMFWRCCHLVIETSAVLLRRLAGMPQLIEFPSAVKLMKIWVAWVLLSLSLFRILTSGRKLLTATASVFLRQRRRRWWRTAKNLKVVLLGDSRSKPVLG